MTQYDILVVFVVLLLIGSVIFLMACQGPVKKSRAKKANASKKTSAKAKKSAPKSKKSTKKRK